MRAHASRPHSESEDPLRTEVIHVGGSRKELRVEIPPERVGNAIERASRRYGRSVKVPGFRPGKVPPEVARKRFREQILRDVAEDLVSRAVDDALREHDLSPVASPEIRDVEVDEGKPLTFTALFEIVPPVDPGAYDAFVLRRPPPAAIDDEEVDREVEQLRTQVARSEPVEGRPAETGDTVTLDLERRLRRPDGAEAAPERHVNVTVEIGSPDNPPGFDDHLRGVEAGASREFTLPLPAQDGAPDVADAPDAPASEARYTVKVRGVHRRGLPELDDEFAKDLGDFDDLAALRARIRSDLERAAREEVVRGVRVDLLRQLAARMTGDVPGALVAAEVERRVAHLVRQMLGQRIDPRRAKIDWDAFRDQQRESATELVRSALVLDEIARRESLEVSENDLEQEFARQSAATGQSVPAVRAAVDKDDGRNELSAGLRREKTIDFLLVRATILNV